MKYLLDTNVVSELRRSKPHGGVLAWKQSVPPGDTFISAVAVGEIQAGLEGLRNRNDDRLAVLENWLESLLIESTVLPMDSACFRCWAKLMNGRSRAIMEDAMIAATALVHGFTVVTRNTKDFLDFGVPLLDPFAPP